jgi:hypothetical protein
MVPVRFDRFDHLVDEHPALALGCGVPDGVHVDLGEVAGDLLEVRGPR